MTTTITTVVLLLAISLLPLSASCLNLYQISNCCDPRIWLFYLCHAGRLEIQEFMPFLMSAGMIIWRLRLIVTLLMEEEDDGGSVQETPL